MNTTRLQMIETMLKENKHDPFLNYAAALEYKKIGDLNESLKLLELLVDNHPDYLASYYQLGKVREKLGDLKEAIIAYKMGMQIAESANDQKTRNELAEAIQMLE